MLGVKPNSRMLDFKMDLSGFCEYRYSLWLSHEAEAEEAMTRCGRTASTPMYW